MKNKKYILILLVFVLISYFYNNTLEKEENYKEVYKEEKTILNNEYLKVHYLDVGQADSIFIEINKDKTMLIDAGLNTSSDKIISYIDNLGYNKIDYLIATHPHADHIGGMKEIINKYEIGDIYMPKVVSNTKTYENLLKAIEQKGKKIKTAKAPFDIINDNDLKIEIISPVEDSYEDLNDYSVCIKITYKEVSYLFMGDASKLVEEQINTDVSADIIKVAHHGSNTSSSLEFIKKVNPTYAVISVGKDNSYNHPHQEVIDRYKSINTNIYRTDLNGNIIISTDGKNIKIDKEK